MSNQDILLIKERGTLSYITPQNGGGSEFLPGHQFFILDPQAEFLWAYDPQVQPSRTLMLVLEEMEQYNRS